MTFYVGPKDFDTLAVVDRDLVKAINFGIFSILVVPLLRSLNWIHSYVGNYGWSILLLTVFINMVLFPLNHKSVVSMRKMQEIQPETKAIQERYAKYKTTDPERQKMNTELMALYRERGVNPASGCIPILLTLPVFLAFYALLTTAIELRGAPFFGWMHDLSQPDPFYVLPVLVGLSQIVTQWMTPQAGVDPTQQKMMLIMPVVLIFVFISTPVGALIYWLVGKRVAARPAVPHELLDRSAQYPHDSSGRRTTPQARWKRKDRRRRLAGITDMADQTAPIVDFLNRFAAALKITTPIDVEPSDDGPRLNLSGEEAELLVRHRGEPLKALQHVVDMAYGRSLDDEKRVFIDALAYRKGKDVELRQMAKYSAEKAKETGADQQLGRSIPTNVGSSTSRLPKCRASARRASATRSRKPSTFPRGSSRVFHHDTIVAIATPPGRGGLGIVRLSGADAGAITTQLIARTAPLVPRHATFCTIAAPAGDAIDQVVVTYFPRPLLIPVTTSWRSARTEAPSSLTRLSKPRFPQERASPSLVSSRCARF